LPRPDGGLIARTGIGAHGYVDPRSAAYRNIDLDAVNDMAAVANGLDEIGFIAHCREPHMPRAFQRTNRDDYEQSGRHAAFEEARDMALALIAAAPPEGSLTEDQNKEIVALVARADIHIVEAYKREVTVI
jgi:hypothetical protein